MHAIWHGMLHTLGRFDVSLLTDAEIANYDGILNPIRCDD